MINFNMKQIDDDAFWLNGVIVQHFIDGSFNIFKTEYEYKCFSYDDYPDTNEKPFKTFRSLYKLLKYLEDFKNE